MIFKNMHQFFCFAVCLLIFGCGTYKNITDSIYGKYVQVNEPSKSLNFFDGNFVYIDDGQDGSHLANYRCCDTISKGEFVIDDLRGLVELSSPVYFSKNTLNVEVIEKEDNTKPDSLVFIFDNPISNENEYHKELTYSIEIFSEEVSKLKKSDEAMVVFDRVNDLKTILISVYPKSDILLSNFGTNKIDLVKGYNNVINPNSNTFIIKTSDLNYEFLNHKRLVMDYVKIVDNKTLQWDGKKYIKEDSGNVTN